MRHFDNELENYSAKLREVAELMEMELEVIKTNDSTYHYYNIKPKKGLNFLIMREKTGKFEISLRPPKIKFKCKGVYKHQVYTSGLIRHGEKFTYSINVSQHKSAQTIAFEIDRRLFDTWKILSDRFQKLKKEELKKDRTQLKTRKIFTDKGFKFIEHIEEKCFLDNFDVHFSGDWKSVYSFTVKGISKKDVFDIISLLNKGKK